MSRFPPPQGCWRTLNVNDVTLSKGPQIMRIAFDEHGLRKDGIGNFDLHHDPNDHAKTVAVLILIASTSGGWRSVDLNVLQPRVALTSENSMIRNIGPARQVLGMICVFGAATVIFPPATAQPVAKPATRPSEPDGTPEAMIAHAQAALRYIQAQQDMGEAITPPFIQVKAAVARRLLDAQRELAREKGDKALELAALESYVAHLRETHRVLSERYLRGLDASRITVEIAAIDLAEAKLWLARAKGGAGAATRPATAPADSQPK